VSSRFYRWRAAGIWARVLAELQEQADAEGERCLELFKVTSKGGVAEVWLLGQRLLELPAGARP